MTTRTAVVTGGLGGLGTEICKHLARAGRKVVAADLAGRADRVDEFRRETAEFNGAIRFEDLDVTDEASCAELVRRAAGDSGGVDILVNAAGITAPKTTILESSLAEWHRILDVNLIGTYLASRAIGRHMVAADYGRIVNLGSVAGKEGNPFSAAYSASKAAVHSFTKSMAKELAKTGVRVNCVTPAIIATKNLYHDMPEEMRKLWVSRVPMGRPGTPEEVAAMICWLASEECSFTSGAAFDLSGGRATY